MCPRLIPSPLDLSFVVSTPSQAKTELDHLLVKSDYCLVIDGSSLQVYLDHYRQDFFRIAMQLPAVVCCRCSPQQKADMVHFLKQIADKRVAAVGDGGNDVSMIQAADVGKIIVADSHRLRRLVSFN